ncbi:TPA: cell envelope integrity protein TolA [Candidatus Galligastranaerophilus intestinavium]|uniref:Cell envelope integrity protein TolA n=1 Tax=Candidatus Galligastranaerophilus intestinavium TaxID=2840836 RepID=A0A9D1FJK5_9BACT|nr:cell envelope integrity protein TolA [Candidatus Galligastranaerophilus intestinavium]
MKKFLLILLGIVTLNLCAFAIESDFKNSLLKVDYVKTGNDSYNIRLFTQKPYGEPIKVIKKTNTSYYILLPETFHSVGSVAPFGDIKSTEVKLFPYAGQDLNNGYTKISIYTSKPLNIKTQLNSSTKSVAPSINAKDLAKLDSAFNKNQTSNEQAQRQAQIKAQQEAQRQAQLKAQQAREAAQKAEAQRQAQLKAQQEAQRQAQLKAQQEAQRQAQARAQAQKEAQLKAQQEAQRQAQLKAQQAREAAQKAEAQRQAQLKAQQEAQRQAQIKAQQAREAAQKAEAQRQAQLKAQQEAQRQAQLKAQQEAQQNTQETSKTNSNNLQVSQEAAQAYYRKQGQGSSEEKKSQTESDINKAPQDINTENVVTQDIVNPQDIEKIPEISEKINQKSYTKIIKNKLSFFKPYYYVICDNFTLFITLAIALIGIILLIAISKSKKKGTSKTMNCEQPSENEKKSSIENLTKEINETYKTGLEEELSNKAEQEAQAFKDEFKDLMEQNEQQKAPEPVKEDEQYEEPQVISSVEIAPMRGFMIIETRGVKALFGYIHDDVFLLYQFREFISNYDIKYRISEKQIDKTFFIVKIDKFKLLIKVTNTSMRLELEM